MIGNLGQTEAAPRGAFLFLAKPRRQLMLPRHMDSNIWGVLCVPIGILFFFGPALWVAAFGSADGPDVALRGKPRD